MPKYLKIKAKINTREVGIGNSSRAGVIYPSGIS
jgi:hypothetical protein